MCYITIEKFIYFLTKFSSITKLPSNSSWHYTDRKEEKPLKRSIERHLETRQALSLKQEVLYSKLKVHNIYYLPVCSLTETGGPSRLGVWTKTVALYSVSGERPVKQWLVSDPRTVISCPLDPVKTKTNGMKIKTHYSLLMCVQV